MRLNEVDFHVELDGSGPPLLLLHGFTGSTRAWDEVWPTLAATNRVIAIDLLGHGRSAAPEDPGRYSLAWATLDLVALLDQLGLPEVAVLGYSMGGRIALHLALDAPDRVTTLILESASPGIETDAERRRRIESDAALADRIERDGISSFVAEWEQQPLLVPAPHVSLEARARQHGQRLENNSVGLANSLRGMGAGQQASLWSRLAALRMPTQLIVGERDSRYMQIGQRMHEVLLTSNLAVVPAAGHTVHLDQPQRFVTLVRLALDNKLTHRPGRC